jgi:hypothetical protein
VVGLSASGEFGRGGVHYVGAAEGAIVVGQEPLGHAALAKSVIALRGEAGICVFLIAYGAFTCAFLI